MSCRTGLCQDGRDAGHVALVLLGALGGKAVFHVAFPGRSPLEVLSQMGVPEASPGGFLAGGEAVGLPAWAWLCLVFSDWIFVPAQASAARALVPRLPLRCMER